MEFGKTIPLRWVRELLFVMLSELLPVDSGFKRAFDSLEDDRLSVFKVAPLEIRQHNSAYTLMTVYIALAHSQITFYPQVFHKLFVAVGLLLDIPKYYMNSPKKCV